jgi:nitroreductase
MSGVPGWLDGARGAPSAHNTQPWRFQPQADGRIAVLWAPERALPASDPTGRDLRLSLGAAVESAILAASADGSPLRFVPAQDGERRVGYLEPSGESPAGRDVHLARYLGERHTARKPHLPRPLPPGLVGASREEAARQGYELRCLTDARSIRRLGRVMRRATAAAYADGAVHEELWRWLRLDPRRPEYRRDGLTAGALDLRALSHLLARVCLPPPRMRLLVRLGLHHALALEAGLTLRRSASLWLLAAPSGGGDLLHAGRTLQRLWLLATSEGLTTHPASALIDSEAAARDTLMIFGAGGLVPLSVYRMGYSEPVERSPRLPAGDLLEYGKRPGTGPAWVAERASSPDSRRDGPKTGVQGIQED